MKRGIVPIEELLAAVREGGSLFDRSVDVDALGERVGGVYEATTIELDDPEDIEALADDDAPTLEGAEEGGGALAEGEVLAEESGDELDDDEEYALEEARPARAVTVARPSEPDVPFAPHRVHGEARAFGVASVRLMSYVRSMARRIAQGDAQFEEDLVQEAQIELWEIDASRFDEEDQMYLKRALVTRMIKAAEREFVEGTGVPRTRLREHLAGHTRAHRR